MQTKTQNSIVQSTLHIPRENHKQFKAIVIANGATLGDVYASLIKRYIEENRNVLESLKMSS